MQNLMLKCHSISPSGLTLCTIQVEALSAEKATLLFRIEVCSNIIVSNSNPILTDLIFTVTPCTTGDLQNARRKRSINTCSRCCKQFRYWICRLLLKSGPRVGNTVTIKHCIKASITR